MPETRQFNVFNSYKLIYCKDSFCIKGAYELASYDDNVMALKCTDELIFVSGENIVINSLDEDEIYISGKILNISFS